MFRMLNSHNLESFEVFTILFSIFKGVFHSMLEYQAVMLTHDELNFTPGYQEKMTSENINFLVYFLFLFIMTIIAASSLTPRIAAKNEAKSKAKNSKELDIKLGNPIFK